MTQTREAKSASTQKSRKHSPRLVYDPLNGYFGVTLPKEQTEPLFKQKYAIHAILMREGVTINDSHKDNYIGILAFVNSATADYTYQRRLANKKHLHYISKNEIDFVHSIVNTSAEITKKFGTIGTEKIKDFLISFLYYLDKKRIEQKSFGNIMSQEWGIQLFKAQSLETTLKQIRVI